MTFLLLLCSLLLLVLADTAPATSPTPAPPRLPCVDPVIKTKLGEYTYSISSLQGKLLSGPASAGGKYFFNLCTDAPTGPPFCTNRDSVHPTAMAAYCPVTQTALAIASAKAVTERSYSALGGNEKAGLLLRVQPLDTVIKGGFEVQLICNAKTKVPLFRGLMKETPLGFNFSITTSAACPTFVPTPPTGEWSTIFIVVFCVVTVLYCGVGCFINVRAGVSVTQACPHRVAWCNLPGLVGAGCTFFMGCICSSSGDGSRGGEKKKSAGGGNEKNGESTTTDRAYAAMKDNDALPIAATSNNSNYGTESLPIATPVEVMNEKDYNPLSSTGNHNDRNDDFADTVF